jgi:proline dehydrogenase
MNRSQLLESIARTIQDYRKGEINQITLAHVEKWIKQFDVHDQNTILFEIDRLLKRFYFSKEQVKGFLRDFLTNRSLFGADPLISLARTNFLHI